MESAAGLAKELRNWTEVADFYRKASDLYMECSRPQPASDALAKAARYVCFSFSYVYYVCICHVDLCLCNKIVVHWRMPSRKMLFNYTLMRVRFLKRMAKNKWLLISTVRLLVSTSRLRSKIIFFLKKIKQLVCVDNHVFPECC